MDDYMQPIRDELHILAAVLDNDQRQFNEKLSCTRNAVCQYLDEQVAQLMRIRDKYNEELTYLDDENRRTCLTNQRAFDKVCQSINQNDDQPDKVIDLLAQFKSSFPLRPRMLQDIPEFDFQSIDFEQLIRQRQNIPVDQFAISTDGSTGHSHHKQNNENDFQPQSRLVSTYSTTTNPEATTNLLFKIPYSHSRTPHLIAYHDQEESLLMYSFQSRQLEHLSCRTRQRMTIDLPFTDPILNLGFWKTNQLFYLSTRQSNRVILFRLNDTRIDIVEEYDLLSQGDYFINVHISENMLIFLYVTSSIIMLGKFDLKSSTRLLPFSFYNRLYDADENSTFRIMDFAIHDSLIAFLIQLNRNKKWMIRIYDSDTMYKLRAFDLVGADKPISIVSAERRSISGVDTDDADAPLLFVNDPKGQLIHCCTYREYIAPIRVNAFGICAFNDGNLSIVAERDVRGLKVNDNLRRNTE